MVDTFTYRHALQGKSIRLLKVLPGSAQSTLSIQLSIFNLGECEFEALSYVWGNQTGKIQTRCNDSAMAIGANLHAALIERRRRKSTVLLWADQVCINQEDTEEKTRQVQMMSRIYARASQVIIWLGAQHSEDERGIRLAETLYEKCSGHRFDARDGVYDFHDFDCQSKGVPEPRFNPEWTALFRIISNTWFSRIWVVQELLMAQESVLWKGSLTFNTDVMMWMAIQIQRHRNLYENFDIYMGSPVSSALMARNVAEGYYDRKKKGRLPLYDTLSKYAGMGATDTRDRFFALVGLSSGISESFVSYEKSFADLACLVGKMTLLGISNYELGKDGRKRLVLETDPKEHRFLIEWLAYNANPQNHKLGIPSWVPDLISPHYPGLLLIGFYNTLYLQGSRKLPNPDVRLSEQFRKRLNPFTSQWEISVPSEIEIKGAIFDEVRIVARKRPPFSSPDSHTDRNNIDSYTTLEKVSQYEAEMVHWLSELRLLADPLLDPQGSIMDGSSFDTFWRTLVYNRGQTFNYDCPNQAAESELGISFGYWYLHKKFQMARCWRLDLGLWAIHDKMLQSLAAPFEGAEGRVRHARHFFVSQGGRIGWVPFRTRAGDQICVFQGMRMPLVVRQRGERWEIIGACYVQGLMDGELWDLAGLSWTYMRFA